MVQSPPPAVPSTTPARAAVPRSSRPDCAKAARPATKAYCANGSSIAISRGEKWALASKPRICAPMETDRRPASVMSNGPIAQRPAAKAA